MILHQHITPQQVANLDPWWVVDARTLTLFLCHRNATDRYDLRHIPHPPEPPAASSCEPEDFAESRLRVRMDLFRAFPLKGTAITAYGRYFGNPPPEWLLLNSVDGETPAVMHTADPVFVAVADPSTGLLAAPEYFRSSVDLSPEGWAYWWEDAQRAFERLSVDSAAAHGITVPAHISGQV